MSKYSCDDCDATFEAPTDTDTCRCPGCGEMATKQPADAERRDRYAAAVNTIVGYPSETMVNAVMAVADTEQDALRAALARVRALADAIDAELGAEPDTRRAAMQQEAVVRLRAALDGHPLHGHLEPADRDLLWRLFDEIDAQAGFMPSVAVNLKRSIESVIRAHAVPPASADRDLRDRIADALSNRDLAYFSEQRRYDTADAVLAVLPAPADRAAVLREAADVMDAHCEQYGVLGVGDRLRRMADEAQQAEPTPGAS